MYVQTDEMGRILVTVSNHEYTDESYIEFEFPADFDFSKQNSYRIVENELIYDPLPEPVEQQIEALKAKLKETDYIVTKIYEASVTEKALPEEEVVRYADIIEQRRSWRAQINELETLLEGGD